MSFFAGSELVLSDARPSDAGEYSCSDGPDGNKITHIVEFGSMYFFIPK